jgi:3-oxoadipate enol-lactonase
MFDEGNGPAIVVVQPLQGRWEWTRPLLRELARRARVISYSLSGDLGSGRRMDAAAGFDGYVTQLREVMDTAGIDKAALFGISFGGAVAARFAAESPQRVAQLVIASSPGPGWQPSATQAKYVARPWMSMPAFVAGALGRVLPEVAAAIDGWTGRAGFAARYGLIALRYPMLPHLMARRVRMLERVDLCVDCARIAAPTLVVTGDAALDHVVPVASTRRYVELIRGARYVVMEGTGHLGVLTQPKRFAALVSDFVNGSHS